MRISYFRFAALLTVLMSIGSATFAQTKAFDTIEWTNPSKPAPIFFNMPTERGSKTRKFPRPNRAGELLIFWRDNNNTIFREVLESAAKTKAAPGSDAQLDRRFLRVVYGRSGDRKSRRKTARHLFQTDEKIKSVEDLQRQIAMMHNAGLPALFSFGGGADLKNSSMVIVNAGQGGLSLPNRNYYTDSDAKSVETRQKFVEYMTNMFKLLGDKPETAAANAKTVLDIQMRLAKASLDPVDHCATPTIVTIK
jgi:putative endopeptidase